MKDRGFKKLKGKTIKDVDLTAVNTVRLLCEDGSVFTIGHDDSYFGHPVVTLTKEKAAVKKKPDEFTIVNKPKPVPKELQRPRDPWPFPTTDSMKHPGGSSSFDEKKGRGPTPSEVVKKQK